MVEQGRLLCFLQCMLDRAALQSHSRQLLPTSLPSDKQTLQMSLKETSMTATDAPWFICMAKVQIDYHHWRHNILGLLATCWSQ